MARSSIARIREKIQQRKYDMSAHAMEEMAEDHLDIMDIEHVILHGDIARMEKDDMRGTKYVIEGIALDRQTPVGIVGRFTASERYVIITVYAITN